jgi:hypothetical protein
VTVQSLRIAYIVSASVQMAVLNRDVQNTKLVYTRQECYLYTTRLKAAIRPTMGFPAIVRVESMRSEDASAPQGEGSLSMCRAASMSKIR